MANEIWSNTPPTEPGWYWVWYIGGDVAIAFCNTSCVSCRMDYRDPNSAAKAMKFGPRIPSAEELAAIAKTVRVRNSAAFAELDAAVSEAFGVDDEDVT